MHLTRRTIGVVCLAAAAAASLYVLWLARAGLYPFVLGALGAYLLYPLVAFLERRGLRRGWSLAAVYAAGFLFFLGSGVLFLPLLLRELESFAHELPEMMRRAEALLHVWQEGYQSWALPLSLREAIDAALAQGGARLTALAGGAVAGILGAVSYAIGIAVSPVLAFYLLYDWRRIRHALLGVLPAARRAAVVAVCRDINGVLHGVIRGQLLISLLVGALVTLGLWLLGVRYALLIGVLAGLLDVIPYFGAIIGAVPAVCTALLYSPGTAVKAAALFFFVHQAESALIQPRVIGDSVGLHPLAVIFFVFIGEELGGLAGMLLGVPAAAVARILLRHAYRGVLTAREEP